MVSKVAAAEFYAGRAAVSNALRNKLQYRVVSYDVDYSTRVDLGSCPGFAPVTYLQ